MKHDFLKNWKVVRYFIQKQYNLTIEELEMLLFLYSEKRFTKKDFRWFESIMSWEPKRFERLKEKGYIKEWMPNYKGARMVFELTHQSKMIVAKVYNLLLGEEKFPESERNILTKDSKGIGKRYMKAMMNLNKKKSTTRF